MVKILLKFLDPDRDPDHRQHLIGCPTSPKNVIKIRRQLSAHRRKLLMARGLPTFWTVGPAILLRPPFLSQSPPRNGT